MYDVMQGVRVIEVAEHTFVPAAGMVLADWGADVIKIERRGGDAALHLASRDGSTPAAALAGVEASRPVAAPDPGLWARALAFYASLRGSPP